MILTAHQPVYLPWLGLFHKIALADTFVLFDDVQYLPKDWNNRNKIWTMSGDMWLTVPVITKGHREKPIRTIEINNQLPWRRKHWRSLAFNYNTAPYFKFYAPFFEDLYNREWKYLAELNEYMLRWFLSTLGITVNVIRASDLGLNGRKSDLVLDMCKRLGAKTYIFGALGRNYAKVDDFESQGVRLLFQDYRHPVYSQLQGAFRPHLSVVDLLFNCGKRSLEILMHDNIDRKSLSDGVCEHAQD